MLAYELRDQIVRHLVRQHGGSTMRWRKALGQLRVYSLATHGHCNWDAAPSGSVGDVARIERALDDLRLRYPYVDTD